MRGLFNWKQQNPVLHVSCAGYLQNADEVQRALQLRGQRVLEPDMGAVMLAAYREWGLGFVERFVGAFAFVLWDPDQHQLVMGRDPLGLKTLYYAECAGVVAYGSRLQDVLAHHAVPRELHTAGLSELLAMGPYFSPGQAVLHGVQEVRVAHLVVHTPERVRRHRYWQLTSEPHTDRLETTVEKLRDMLTRNVTEQMNAAVPATVILSGGLDSSGLTALAAQKHPDLQTFSINTPESLDQQDVDGLDAPWVWKVAKHLGLTNREVVVGTPEVLQAQLRLDLPGQAEFDIMHYLVYKQVGETHGIALLGEGSDEMFGSQSWFYNAKFRDRASFPWVHPLLHKICTGEVEQAEEYVQERYQDALRQVPPLAGESPEQARIREVTYLTLQHYLPFLTRRVERLTEAAGIEARLPFCDPQLIHYAWNLPWELKTYGGQKKGVLREVFRSCLPDEVVNRQKSNAPVVFSSAYTTYLCAQVEAILDDPHAPLHYVLDQAKVRELLRTVHQDLFWRFRLDYLVEVNSWLRTNAIRIV
ncbi:asparagine synthase (glutamine-hydrolyzing) [Tumebacillus permanentifrigoris]|uniref:asparagine synthase (glutamine-hydrolyzing) n=1 Tax=Tumebacillus permanentifrigoris TaxID=378543 RepID=A0A316D8D4_9BACL|nr:asparagine synthase (glutamine-hydrolyzing) [Tumebacillus permanentifrigoris]PWK13109.1 asparagine synthase (glutamine-hydrolysing) [Tumebacillus permanentifrigoris]